VVAGVPAFDGDKSPAESGENSPHSKGFAAFLPSRASHSDFKPQGSGFDLRISFGFRISDFGF
jgi:hypothetical protein